MSYSSVVLGDSPVAYWRLQETSGTAAMDSSGNAINGTYTGGYTSNQSSTGVSGDVSVNMDGTSGYVEIPTSTTLNSITNDFSVEGWVKITNWNNSWGIVGGNGVTNPAPKFMVGTANNGGTMRWKLTKFGVVDIYLTAAIPNDANWHHIVATFSSTAGVTLYIDGVVPTGGTYSDTSNLESSQNFVTALGLGSTNASLSGSTNGSTNDYGLAGYMQEVAIYNKVLTSTQVSNHYNAATSSSGTTVTGTATGGSTSSGSASSAITISASAQGGSTSGGTSTSTTSSTIDGSASGGSGSGGSATSTTGTFVYASANGGSSSGGNVANVAYENSARVNDGSSSGGQSVGAVLMEVSARGGSVTGGQAFANLLQTAFAGGGSTSGGSATGGAIQTVTGSASGGSTSGGNAMGISGTGSILSPIKIQGSFQTKFKVNGSFQVKHNVKGEV